MTLSFDIETVGRELDEDFTAAVVKHAADKKRVDEPAEDPLTKLGLSPFTGRVVVIACWDDVEKAGVCIANDNLMLADLPTGFVLAPRADEKGMLETFWGIARRQRRFATFNGQRFDVPFLVGRSLALDVRIHPPLINAKPWEDLHVDLMAKLAPPGTRSAPFDFVCRALGVPTPKDGGITGADVAAAWSDGRRADVAAYCCRDTFALAQCLTRWDRCTTIPRSSQVDF